MASTTDNSPTSGSMTQQTRPSPPSNATGKRSPPQMQERSRNAVAQARHRAKRKAYIEQVSNRVLIPSSCTFPFSLRPFHYGPLLLFHALLLAYARPRPRADRTRLRLGELHPANHSGTVRENSSMPYSLPDYTFHYAFSVNHAR